MNNKRSDLMITGAVSQLDLNGLYNVNKPLSQWQGPFDSPLQDQGMVAAPPVRRPETLAGLSAQTPARNIASFPQSIMQNQAASMGLSTSAPLVSPPQEQQQGFAITPMMLNDFINEFGPGMNTSMSSPQMGIPEALQQTPEEPPFVSAAATQDPLDLSFFQQTAEVVSFKIGDTPKEEETASPTGEEGEAPKDDEAPKVEEVKVEKKQRTLLHRWFKKSSETPPPSPDVEEPKPIVHHTPKASNVDDGRMGNEQKFMGEGQTFKGKLIGVLEVQNARGDRMCQDALQELKIAVKASGEHKQRIIIHIAVDGLKIRDEKNGDCLYHHPVHKISFIAQDMADSRAFGYIYGSPENGHRFFGIKTEKAAAQVVVAMRDLFQVVFDLKQQEIEQTKKQLDCNPGNIKREDSRKPDVISGTTPSNVLPESTHQGQSNHSESALNNKGALSDLLGLQDELTHIQAGIRQIDKIAPTAPMSFQTDSMIPLGVRNNSLPMQQQQQQQQQQPQQQPLENHVIINKRPAAIMNSNPANLSRSDAFGAAPFLPPPPSKSGGRASRPIAVSGSEPIYGTHTQNTPPMHSASPMLHLTNNNAMGSGQISKTPTNMIHNTLNNFSSSDKYKSFDSFEEPNKFGGFQLNGQGGDPNGLASKSFHGSSHDKNNQSVGMISNESFESVGAIPQFTDLDPLGTGKSKPYMERKDFFSELKTPTSRINELASSPGSDVLSSSVGSLSGIGAFGETAAAGPVSSKVHPNSFSDNFSSDSPTMWHCGHRSSSSKDCRKTPSIGGIPTLRMDSSEESHYGYGHLKVSLPPDECSTSGDTYGSIPHLEASPRRYRRDIFPNTSTNIMSNSVNLGIPSIYSSSSKKNDDSDQSQDTPPKLPERPSKTSNISPPPLPPKKPLSQQSSWKLMSSSCTAAINPSNVKPDNIYDFPLDPPSHKTQQLPSLNIPPVRRSNNFVSIEELSKMSVMELNDKMTSGQLPVELQGMSIIALVDFVSQQMKNKSVSEEKSSDPYPFIHSNKEESRKSQDLPLPIESSMKPSFSDNFVSPNKKHEEEAPPCDVPTTDPLSFSPAFDEVPSSSLTIPSDVPEDGRCTPTPFPDTNRRGSSYDKYAVLRELALEDEIMRAWQSDPEDDEKGHDGDKEDEEEDDQIPGMNADSDNEDDDDNFRPRSPTPSEDKVISDDESQEDKETRQYFNPPPVCSSEGSPCSRSESDDNKSDDDDDGPISVDDDLDQSMDHKRDSQVPLCDEDGSRCPSNTQFEDNFSDAFGSSSDPVVHNPGGWTTFEEELPSKSNWEKEESSKKDPLRFRHYPSKYGDDGFESSDSSSRYVSFSRNESLRGSNNSDHSFSRPKEGRRLSSGEYSYTPNPFNDNFIPPVSFGRQSEEETGSDALSLIIHDPEKDVFDSPQLLEESGFKVTAKVASNFTKSESVNIFEIKEDPFDDDFFK